MTMSRKMRMMMSIILLSMTRMIFKEIIKMMMVWYNIVCQYYAKCK